MSGIEGGELSISFAAHVQANSTYVAPPALSIPSCLIVSLAELYRRNPAVVPSLATLQSNLKHSTLRLPVTLTDPHPPAM
jgi:hypothetical protein